MHVPVDDRDALGAMRLLRVPGGDRGIVEEAEPHGAGPLGVVAGRAHRREGVPDPRPSSPRRRPARRRRRRAAPPPRCPATWSCRRRSRSCRRAARPPRSPSRRRPDGRAPPSPRSPSGAGSRTSPAKRSSSSARSIARMRSGRSGWPGGVWWSSAAGWLRRSVDMLAFGSRDRFAALSQPTPELSMTRAIAAVTAMQHGHALRPRPCPRGFRIGSAGRNPRAA